MGGAVQGIPSGIPVIGLFRLIAGPCAVMVRADLGAGVIKVEAITGEEGWHFARRFMVTPAPLS